MWISRFSRGYNPSQHLPVDHYLLTKHEAVFVVNNIVAVFYQSDIKTLYREMFLVKITLPRKILFNKNAFNRLNDSLAKNLHCYLNFI